MNLTFPEIQISGSSSSCLGSWKNFRRKGNFVEEYTPLTKETYGVRNNNNKPTKNLLKCCIFRCSLVILLAACLIVILVWRIWCWIGRLLINTLIDIFLYSHHLSAWYRTNIVRRNYIFVSHGNLRIDDKNTYLLSSLI